MRIVNILIYLLQFFFLCLCIFRSIDYPIHFYINFGVEFFNTSVNINWEQNCYALSSMHVFLLTYRDFFFLFSLGVYWVKWCYILHFLYLWWWPGILLNYTDLIDLIYWQKFIKGFERVNQNQVYYWGRGWPFLRTFIEI